MKSFVIVSAEKTTNTPAENDRQTMQLLDFLERTELEFTKVHGMYQGIREDSFLVILPDNENHARDHAIGLLWDEAERLKQESILLVQSDGRARLIFADESQYLGMWHNVSEVEAKAHGAYTQIGELFYVAK